MMKLSTFGLAVAFFAVFLQNTEANATDSSIEVLQKQIDALKATPTDIQTLQKQIDALKAAPVDIQALQKEIEQLKANQTDVQALQKQIDALKAAPPSAPVATASVGTFPGSFVVPGTRTSFKVGGFADLSTTFDTNTSPGQAGYLSLNGFQPKTITPNSITSLGATQLALPGTPAAKEVGRAMWSPRYSRLYLETRTPTEYGEIKFYIESDFDGEGLTANKNTSYSVSPRLRQAYGTIGNLAIGQIVSIVADGATNADTIDNNGAFVGYETGNRMPAIQYRWDVDRAQKTQIYVALEAPFNDFVGRDSGDFAAGGTEGQPSDSLNHLPDFVAKIAENGSWGRVFASGDIRQIKVDTFGVAKVYGTNRAQVVNDTVIGGSFTAGGKLYTGLGDNRNAVTFRVDGGQGAGRILMFGAPSAVVDDHGHIQLQQQGGFGVNYQHWFNDKWKANAIYGLTHMWNKLAYQSNQGLWKQSQAVELNAFWLPTSYANIGVAYTWVKEDAVQGYDLTGVPGATRAVSGVSAFDNRFELRSRFGF